MRTNEGMVGAFYCFAQKADFGAGRLGFFFGRLADRLSRKPNLGSEHYHMYVLQVFIYTLSYTMALATRTWQLWTATPTPAHGRSVTSLLVYNSMCACTCECRLSSAKCLIIHTLSYYIHIQWHLQHVSWLLWTATPALARGRSVCVHIALCYTAAHGSLLSDVSFYTWTSAPRRLIVHV
jgi:hypothetical protein